jgi:photosystem II stability/assembly factor-like uncharacterized protein
MKRNLVHLILGIGLLILLVQSSSAQWVRTNGLIGQSVAALAVRDSNILAAIPNAHSGVFLSTNNGITWTAELTREITCFAVDGNDILAGSSLVPGVYLSTNGGTSWTEINGTALQSGSSISNILCLAVNGNNIFAGTYTGVYLSTNNGASWTAMIDSGLPIYSIQSLAVSGNNIFAAVTPPPNWYSPPVNDSIAPAPPSFTSGAYLSTNNGASWTAINSGLPSAVGFCFAVSGGNIFAGMDSGMGGGGGVYLSSNNGTSWTAIDSGFPNAAVFCFAVSGNNVFAATAGGVYLSTNNGISWTKVNSGLTDSTVSSITVIPVSSFAISGNTMYAGTNNGVWRRPISEMLPTNTHEFQNKQPSVSNLRININRTTATVSFPLFDGPVTVGLFTIAGKRIYSARHQPQNGILNIPLAGLSTGTYLMSITGRNGVLRSSFVVTK